MIVSGFRFPFERLATLRDALKSERGARFLVWLLVAMMAASALVYVWVAASPLVWSDYWYYTATLIKHSQEGHLGLLDFIGKRPGDNSQPLNRLILLALASWYQMDLTPQAVLGTLIACSCVLLLSWIAWRTWPVSGKSPWLRTLLPLGFASALLSLNPTGLFTWPLVTTLTFTGSLGAIIYLYLVAELGRQGAWARVGAITFIMLVMLDTFGILTAMATLLLLLHRAFAGPAQERRQELTAALAVFAMLVCYEAGYRWLTAVPSTPLNGANISSGLGYIAGHWREAWKVLVIPFGISIYQPLGKLGYTWQVLIPLAAALWCGHIWFWRHFFRNFEKRAAFLAAGLMLYFYATVAGMLLDRVPEHDFDYLFQPRYIAFYELQLVALLLMVAVVAQRSAAPLRMARLVTLLVSAMLLLNVYFAARAWTAAPSLRRYDENIVAQINWLARDPVHPPGNCYPGVVICRWPLAARVEALDVLRDGRLNVFSVDFRRRHGYVWTEPADAGSKSP